MAKGSALRKNPNDAASAEFAALLDESLGGSASFEGSVVKGTVIRIANDFVTVDVGLKSEGRVSLREFTNGGAGAPEVREGDTVDIFVDRMENKDGEAVLSRDKARREEAWTLLEKAFNDQERVMGTIFGRVKGGFTVDLSGAVAFLPGSQVDVRPVRDVGPLMGQAQQFAILKMDRRRGNIVVSRRAVMEETRAEDRTRLMGNLSEGQVLDGVVKNITDYGAFVDLGGVDGLLHVTDIAWKRINHPSEALTIGQQVKVQVIRFNPETQRISLGMKQLMSDPWDGAGAKYPVGLKLKGRVTNITDYGAFVELEPGVEGLVHVSDLSWDKAGDEAIRDYKKGDQVKVKVLDVDIDKERISLGIKQLENDPFEKVGSVAKKGDVVTVLVAGIQDNGIDVTVSDGIPGFIRKSELSRDRSEQRPDRYAIGDKLDAKITNIDRASRRVVLSVKARELDEEKKAMADFGSSDSGASLGDILGAALSRAQKKGEEENNK